MRGALRSAREIIRRARVIGVIPYLRYSLLSRRRVRRRLFVKVHGHEVVIRTATPDLPVAMSTLGTELRCLETLFPADYDGVIVDAGGYIGTAAMMLATMYPQATVVAVEPSSENFALLQHNTRKYQNVVCLKAALSCDAGAPVRLLDRGTGQWGYTIVPAPLDRADAPLVETAEVVTLGGVEKRCGGRRIGILKLDIEGAERDLFAGDAASIERIPVLFAELHDRIVPGCRQEFDRISANRWVVRAGGEKLLSLTRSSIPL